MAHDIVFFLAADDETAAATRLWGPGEAFEPVTCRFIEPDSAIGPSRGVRGGHRWRPLQLELLTILLGRGPAVRGGDRTGACHPGRLPRLSVAAGPPAHAWQPGVRGPASVHEQTVAGGGAAGE